MIFLKHPASAYNCAVFYEYKSQRMASPGSTRRSRAAANQPRARPVDLRVRTDWWLCRKRASNSEVASEPHPGGLNSRIVGDCRNRHFPICQFWPIDAGEGVLALRKPWTRCLTALRCYGPLRVMFIFRPLSRACILLRLARWLSRFDRDGSVLELGGSALARLVVVSNRVGLNLLRYGRLDRRH
jgi:hypothetical protein